MASRSMNTMSEALSGLMISLTEMKGMPDADLPWIINLETQVLQKIREPFQQQSAAPQGPGTAVPSPLGPGGPGGTAMPAPGPSMPTGVPGGPPPGMMPGPNRPGALPGGLRVGPAAPNPDEIRRMVGG